MFKQELNQLYRRGIFSSLLVLGVLFAAACNPQLITQPVPAAEQAEMNIVPAEDSEVAESMVAFYTSHDAHGRFGMIGLETGVGTDIGAYENPAIDITRMGWPAANGAIYEDAFYTILANRPSPETPRDELESRLARVDMDTGAVELLGDPINLLMMGVEIDPCGTIFATGFNHPALMEYGFGDTNLYRVNPQDGSLALIGDTGIESIMDLGFDPEGQLWATVGNVLYTLDTETGTPTTVATITGVEADSEIMGIGFTSEGQLFATTPFTDGFYSIDPLSGVATEIGRHGLFFPHGGDIPMMPDDVHCDEVADEATDQSMPKFYTSQAAHERFGMIDLDSGTGTDVGPYTHPDFEITRTGWPAANGAIYEDEFYIILNKRLPAEATPDEAEAQLAKVNMQTAEVEVLGDVINLNLMAMEINHCGKLFASGFTLSNALGELYGDTNLYRVDRQDGSLTLIGDTGIERIMDLSFDPEGTLWGTVGNVLYTFDLETGTPTEVAKITGVEEDNEIMGIGFTTEGELFGTTPFSDGFYKIDLETGVVTEVGRHGFAVPHGGDIPMTPEDTSCDD